MIHFGILGTARIAKAFFQSPLESVQIDAIASRETSKAEQFAREFGVARSYGNYDQLLDDPSIQAVYIPLPQHLHLQYVSEAARNGKHVLVEKPAALNVQELHA